MTANIRVGLAAGECVAPQKVRKAIPASIPARWRPVALASAVAAMSP